MSLHRSPMMRRPGPGVDFSLKPLRRTLAQAARTYNEGFTVAELTFRAAPRTPNRILYVTKPRGLMGFDFYEDQRFERTSIFFRGGLLTPSYAAVVAGEA